MAGGRYILRAGRRRQPGANWDHGPATARLEREHAASAHAAWSAPGMCALARSTALPRWHAATVGGRMEGQGWG